jgi:hypothetical protein
MTIGSGLFVNRPRQKGHVEDITSEYHVYKDMWKTTSADHIYKDM